MQEVVRRDSTESRISRHGVLDRLRRPALLRVTGSEEPAAWGRSEALVVVLAVACGREGVIQEVRECHGAAFVALHAAKDVVPVDLGDPFADVDPLTLEVDVAHTERCRLAPPKSRARMDPLEICVTRFEGECLDRVWNAGWNAASVGHAMERYDNDDTEGSRSRWESELAAETRDAHL